ncbi:hypothetical protein LCGC14_2383260, partial [marine sediment metagenome]
MRLPMPRAGSVSLPRQTFDLQEWSGPFGGLGLLIAIVAGGLLNR